MTGMSVVAVSARSARRTSSPERPGIRMSSRTMSGGSSAIALARLVAAVGRDDVVARAVRGSRPGARRSSDSHRRPSRGAAIGWTGACREAPGPPRMRSNPRSSPTDPRSASRSMERCIASSASGPDVPSSSPGGAAAARTAAGATCSVQWPSEEGIPSRGGPDRGERPGLVSAMTRIGILTNANEANPGSIATESRRRQVVPPGRAMASASISTSAAASISRATSTIVVAGRISPKTSPWASPTSCHCAMSVT